TSGNSNMIMQSSQQTGQFNLTTQNAGQSRSRVNINNRSSQFPPPSPSLKVPQKTSGGTRGSLDDETDNLITSPKPTPTPKPKPQNEPKTEANKPSENSIAQSKSITIISANGLDQNAIKSLENHLQSLFLPPDKTGEIVLKFTIDQGRVKNVILDDKASTLKDKQVMEMIKRSLLMWNVPNSNTASVTLRLKVN
ncbi:MAG TPA: after-VIT domain-containing protein, partial [Allocoleopsis sp.]